MKHPSILAALALVAALSCSKGKPHPFQVIPMPNEVTIAKGVFPVKGAAIKVDEALDAPSQAAISAFVQALETATGKALKEGKGGFSFNLNPNLEAEEYFISIDKKGVEVEASALNGFLYACETLKQMLPVEIYGNRKAKADSPPRHHP